MTKKLLIFSLLYSVSVNCSAALPYLNDKLNGSKDLNTRVITINEDDENLEINEIEEDSDLEVGGDYKFTPVKDVPLRAISPDTLKTFVKVIDLVRHKYIEPVNDEQLFVNAMQGMLKNLDPHAEFLDEQSYENLQNFTQGELAGVGLDVNFDIKDGNWVVQSVVPGSPADEVGIEAGFFLHQIDDKELDERTREHDIRQSLQGFAGSMVDLVFSNSGRRMERKTLQRTLSTTASVKVTVDKGIAIVSIPAFQENTRQEILNALVALDTPIYGMILDVRDNPGGVLLSAVEVASLFISESDIVQVEDREGEIQTLKTKGEAYLSDLPLAVLQNRYSASAAEVLTSALQYNKRANIIGEASYGKGTVQSVISLGDGQAVKLTVANYLRPNGSQIDGQGVRADINLVSEDHEQFYENLFNILQSSQKNRSFKRLRLEKINADMKAKLVNEMQWKGQAVNILIDQISEDSNLSPVDFLFQTNQFDNNNILKLDKEKINKAIESYPEKAKKPAKRKKWFF